jgi:hypothetical protein
MILHADFSKIASFSVSGLDAIMDIFRKKLEYEKYDLAKLILSNHKNIW